MHDTAKYLIRANITADGVVERSDVVGAIFGQTEGLLGDELDLRDLQDASKVGRIDVDVDSQNGQSFGTVTIATSLDQVETAILAAALETIDRIGPCRSRIETARIEDVRAARRREVVSRAKTLLTEAFDGSVMSSEELVEEVRRSVRVEDITEYEGYPSGPNVADSDAVVVVEGRSDVLQLLRCGVKNAVAVEGTNVPEEIAGLTRERTVTAFLDGDRGGELILKELAQVGDVDHVAIAPAGRSVEDLSRSELMAALREKVAYDRVADDAAPVTAVAATDGSSAPAPDGESGDVAEPADPAEPTAPPSPGGADDSARGGATTDASAPAERPASTEEPAPHGEPATRDASTATEAGSETGPRASSRADAAAGAEAGGAESEAAAVGSGGEAVGTDEGAPAAAEPPAEPDTLAEHVRRVVGDGSGEVRLLDATDAVLATGPAAEAYDLLADAEPAPAAVVLDGELDQRLLDVAAERDVDRVVARSLGDFVKRPSSVRVNAASRLLGAD